MNGIPVKIPCGRRFMPDNSPWVLARPVSSGLTARTIDRPIVRQDRNHEGFGFRHDVPTQKILKAFLQDLEDCPRLFILTCSPALEGTSVTPPTRSSGSWFDLLPAPSRRYFRHRRLLFQQRQVTDLIRQWQPRVSSPFTAAGPRGIRTLFPLTGGYVRSTIGEPVKACQGRDVLVMSDSLGWCGNEFCSDSRTIRLRLVSLHKPVLNSSGLAQQFFPKENDRGLSM